MASLGFLSNGQVIPFGPLTELVSRGQILFGWIDSDDYIRPICDRDGLLVTYNFDKNEITPASRRKNEVYGVGQKCNFDRLSLAHLRNSDSMVNATPMHPREPISPARSRNCSP